MIKLNNGAICDHEVGAGKTLVMCTAAQEMKRLGLAHKPMIIGLKANVPEIAEAYRTAYPHAKILYPGIDDFTPKNACGFLVILKQRLGLRDTHTRPIFYDTAIARNAKGNSRNRTGQCGA